MYIYFTGNSYQKYKPVYFCIIFAVAVFGHINIAHALSIKLNPFFCSVTPT